MLNNFNLHSIKKLDGQTKRLYSFSQKYLRYEWPEMEQFRMNNEDESTCVYSEQFPTPIVPPTTLPSWVITSLISSCQLMDWLHFCWWPAINHCTINVCSVGLILDAKRFVPLFRVNYFDSRRCNNTKSTFYCASSSSPISCQTQREQAHDT